MSNPFETPAIAETASGHQTFRLKKVGILSVAMFSGTAGLIVGLIGGSAFAFAAVLGLNLNGAPSFGTNVGFGIGMAILLPLAYGIGGFVAGAINAFVYNVLAGLTGGIEFDLAPSRR